jgi:hypothetical protein
MNSASPASAGLELDALHRYWMNGRELDGCTNTLAAVGLINRDRYTEEARDRGSYVHEIIHADLEGDLVEEAVVPEYFGYLTAARTYVRESGIEIIAVEQLLADPDRSIAGRPDVIGRIGARFVIPDWKTGGQERWHGYQGAWYEHLARVNGLISGLVSRVAVYLSEDGTYRTHPHTNRIDWTVAQAAITVVQARRWA